MRKVKIWTKENKDGLRDLLKEDTEYWDVVCPFEETRLGMCVVCAYHFPRTRKIVACPCHEYKIPHIKRVINKILRGEFDHLRFDVGKGEVIE